MKKTILLLSLISLNLWAQTPSKLPVLNVDKNSVTVSGVSAGGFMAIQLNVALSTIFKGAASVAGGTYWCAEGSVLKAQFDCMKKPASINVLSKVQKARDEEAKKAIEPLVNLKRSKIYIYGSSQDKVIGSGNNQKTVEFYSHFMPKENILVRDNIKSGHGWVTKNYGNACEAESLPWLNNCQFDLAGDILKHLYGKLKYQPVSEAFLRSQLYQFDQKEFDSGKSNLFAYGWIYVPKNCSRRNVKCKLHIALHGCQMSPEYVQDQFAVNSGLNSWAEANNILILYPQVDKVTLANPYACWDWWGYTDSNYANRNGQQIISIQKMVYRLMGLY